MPSQVIEDILKNDPARTEFEISAESDETVLLCRAIRSNPFLQLLRFKSFPLNRYNASLLGRAISQSNCIRQVILSESLLAYGMMYQALDILFYELSRSTSSRKTQVTLHLKAFVITNAFVESLIRQNCVTTLVLTSFHYDADNKLSKLCHYFRYDETLESIELYDLDLNVIRTILQGLKGHSTLRRVDLEPQMSERSGLFDFIGMTTVCVRGLVANANHNDASSLICNVRGHPHKVTYQPIKTASGTLVVGIKQLEARPMDAEEVAVLSRLIRDNPGLESLDCHLYANVPNGDLSELIDSLRNHAGVQSLSFRDVSDGDRGAHFLGEILGQNNPTLRTLTVSFTDLSHASFRQGLARNTHLQRLELNTTEVDGRALAAACFHPNSGIRQIKLHGVEGAGNSFLQKLKSISGPIQCDELELEDCDVDNDGAKVLAAFMQKLHKSGTGLRRLSIKSNDIQYPGLKALFAVLKDTDNVGELDLRSLDLCARCISDLAACLVEVERLTSLSLRLNDRVPQETILALVEGVRRNVSLLEMDVSGRTSSIEGEMRKIQAYLMRNRFLLQDESGLIASGLYPRALGWFASIEEKCAMYATLRAKPGLLVDVNKEQPPSPASRRSSYLRCVAL